MRVDSRRLASICLFAGAGGFTLGLERAGFECVGVVEKDDRAAATHSANFKIPDRGRIDATGDLRGDIRNVDFRQWIPVMKSRGIDEIDVIAGGPPCQGFSRVGRGKLNHLSRQHGTNGFLRDPRNQLWFEFFRAIDVLRPRAFIIENVPGMLHHGGHNIAEQICVAGTHRQYRTRCAVLNAAAFGVPQTRERLFILGIRGDIGVTPSFPTGTHAVEVTRGHLGSHRTLEDPAALFADSHTFQGVLLPQSGRPSVTTKQALGDLPPFTHHRDESYRAAVPTPPAGYRPGAPSDYARMMRTWPSFPLTSQFTDHVCKAAPRDYRTFAAMPPGARYPEALAIAEHLFQEERRKNPRKRLRRSDYVPPYKVESFPDKWRKLDPARPSWTVTAHLGKDSYSHIHYDSSQARMITIREAARLQSFPDAFVFSGNMGDRFRQIGNAVPPLLAFGIGQHLRTLFEI